MKKVYVLMLSIGDYDDYVAVPVKVYADPDEIQTDIEDFEVIRKAAYVDWDEGVIAWREKHAPTTEHTDEEWNEYWVEGEKRERAWSEKYTRLTNENFGTELDSSWFRDGYRLPSFRSYPVIFDDISTS